MANLAVIEVVPRLDRIRRLIDAEFCEMPGMRLTHAQARRLWNLSEAECTDALEHLCRSGRLEQDPSGRYVRPRLKY
jgi:hypothetical protein